MLTLRVKMVAALVGVMCGIYALPSTGAGRGVATAVLGPGGIGQVDFGTGKHEVVTSLDALFGAPIARGTNTGCSSRYTEVEWGDLAVEFRWDTFSGYRYIKGGFLPSAVRTLRAAPVVPTLTTAAGISLESSLGQLRWAYAGLRAAGASKWRAANGLLFVDNGEGSNHDAPSSRIIEIKVGTCGDY